MDNLSFIDNYLENSMSVKSRLKSDGSLISVVSAVSDLIVDVYKNGGRVLIAGNGGSAADAQHIAAEFVSRFYFDRPGLPSIALSTDTSMLTAIGNDYGFDKLFSRQVQAQGNEGDVFIGISTSGNSKNILEAVKTCKELGVTSVALCGEGGRLAEMCDYSISIPSKVTPHIQECHICVGHIICAIVEEKIFGND
ncbi:SIS domain-containing protein [Agaribacterium sp. ZY112]|uniref:D-sedoheptulose-7-phosphate isomerase n=1 Tax=Agaribacterium sp. ZY112 TaxID=3233574 RepID=UPI0035252B5D